MKDPETADKLANIDHPYATKRPPIDSFYFETFNRDNVDLVDVRADPIERSRRPASGSRPAPNTTSTSSSSRPASTP